MLEPQKFEDMHRNVERKCQGRCLCNSDWFEEEAPQNTIELEIQHVMHRKHRNKEIILLDALLDAHYEM